MTNNTRPVQHLSLRSVTKSYVTPGGSFTALDDVSLDVATGELVAIVGASGSGKSTLLNLVAGIDRPTRGEVLVQDTRLHTLDESRLAAWRGRHVGVVFQFFQLLPTLTVVENVMLPMDLCATASTAQARTRAMALLDRVGIREQADKLPSALSGGQQQRAAIARALANDPPLLVADEPTGNLDSKNATVVLRLFEELAKQGRTVLIVTHERTLDCAFDRMVTLADGRITSQTPAASAPGVLHA